MNITEGSIEHLSLLFTIALELANVEDVNNDKSPSLFAKAVIKFARHHHHLTAEPLANSKDGRAISVSFDDFSEFCFAQVPMLHVAISSFATRTFFKQQDSQPQTMDGVTPLVVPPSSEELVPPYPIDENNMRIDTGRSGSALFETVSHFQSALFVVSLQSPSLNGGWRRLYTSSIDGLSFNRLARAVCGYQGPTVLLLQDGKGCIFGIYSSSGWKAANQHSGGDSSNFLFRLTPSFKVLSPKSGSDGHYQYLNLNGFSLPHGIGVGGDRCEVKNFRLFLPEEDLDQCRCRSNCTTFESGMLSVEAEEKVNSGEEPIFELVTVELWGVGGTTALVEAANSQKQARAIEDASIQRARKVDKAAFFENSFDREMFLGKTFNQSDGGRR